MDPEMFAAEMRRYRGSYLRRTPSPSLGTPDSTSVDSAHLSDEEWQLRETAKALRSQTKRRALRMNTFRAAALEYKRRSELKDAMATSFFEKYYGALGSIWELQTQIDVLKAEKADLLAQQEAREMAPLPTGKEATTCAVCLGNARSVAFVPCGRIACCRPCAELLVEYQNEEGISPCPICRKHIKAAAQVPTGEENDCSGTAAAYNALRED